MGREYKGGAFFFAPPCVFAVFCTFSLDYLLFQLACNSFLFFFFDLSFSSPLLLSSLLFSSSRYYCLFELVAVMRRVGDVVVLAMRFVGREGALLPFHLNFTHPGRGFF